MNILRKDEIALHDDGTVNDLENHNVKSNSSRMMVYGIVAAGLCYLIVGLILWFM